MFTGINGLLLLYYTVINFATFVIYGIDKLMAVKHAYRVPEKTLILMAGIGGGAGALLGMICFRHKIRKPKFLIIVPLVTIVHIVVLFLLI